MRTEAQQQMGSMLAEYRAMTARVETLASELAAMTATASTSDHSVTATVSPQGELVHLRIDSALAARFDTRTLVARILEASGAAAAVVRQQLRDKMRDLMPAHLRDLVGPDGAVDVRGLLPAHPGHPGHQGHPGHSGGTGHGARPIAREQG